MLGDAMPVASTVGPILTERFGRIMTAAPDTGAPSTSGALLASLS
jgi:hypothetical protein